MLAVFKKECKGYFTSMIGYVCIAFILLFTGIYFRAYNLYYGYPHFTYVLSSMNFIFLICVPILTMRVIADEKRLKTDQMLLTYPVSIGKVIIGKYLALLTVFLVPVLVMCIYPLVLSQFGTMNLPAEYSALFGFFLLGAALLSIGMFMSSLTENMVIAAVLTFVALLFSYLASGLGSIISDSAFASYAIYAALIIAVVLILYTFIKNSLIVLGTGLIFEIALLVLYIIKGSLFEGSIQKFLDVLYIFGYSSNFTDGMFDLQAVLYFLSVIVLFLFLTVQSIQKNRWQ